MQDTNQIFSITPQSALASLTSTQYENVTWRQALLPVNVIQAANLFPQKHT